MSEKAIESSKRVLEPIERVSEILFGLIMVLTFTGSLSIAEAGQGAVRTMLIAALGCNLAWGLIDGIFYLMGCLAEKARAVATLLAVRNSADPAETHRLIAAALPALVAAVTPAAELDALQRRLRQLPAPSVPARLKRDDWLGAIGVFLLVFCSTLPVVIPFVVFRDPMRALRVSNAVAVALLFFAGYVFGRVIGRNRWVMGAAMVVIGSALIGLTVALGG